MEKIKEYLPSEISAAINWQDEPSEIHIKRNARVVYSRFNGKIITDYVCSENCFSHLLELLTNRSFHSQQKNITEGFIIPECGLRVGVVGRAVILNNEITSISEIESVSIRIPRIIRRIGLPVVGELKKRNFKASALIFSPPGVGKTTVLRDIILTVCSTPYNLKGCIIDSRNEIYLPEMKHYPLLDSYIGYPKEKAIEQAVRTMNPDMIFCDEIGNEKDCDAIIKNASCGVPIIATVHADTLERLRLKKNISRLEKYGVFELYFSLERCDKNIKIKKYEVDFV